MTKYIFCQKCLLFSFSLFWAFKANYGDCFIFLVCILDNTNFDSVNSHVCSVMIFLILQIKYINIFFFNLQINFIKHFHVKYVGFNLRLRAYFTMLKNFSLHTLLTCCKTRLIGKWKGKQVHCCYLRFISQAHFR